MKYFWNSTISNIAISELPLNGFVERFNHIVLDKFFIETFRNKLYASVEELQKNLN